MTVDTAHEYETIGLAVADRVATITLNRPAALNPLDPRMAHEVMHALDGIEHDSEVRAVVITGAGRAFSSGADLGGGGLRAAGGAIDVLTPLRTAYNPLLIRLREIDRPVVAAVNGPCVGIGASLAFACDLVLAAQEAYFLLAFVNIGLTMDGGISASVAARAGAARTLEMALLGERVSAEQASAWGLVNRVIPGAELPQAAAALAARLAAGPPASLRASKQLVNATSYDTFAADLDREAIAQQQCAQTQDFVEGVTAFMQKRPADFTGA